MKATQTIMCTWCETVSAEEQLEIILDAEHCPQCGRTGCLLDMQAVAQ
jgi:hypothetical protein